MESESQQQPPYLLLFDGNCNLCHRVVSFVYRRDSRKRIRIQSLQSYNSPLPHGVNFIAGISDSVLFYSNGKWFDQSEAVLELMRVLGGINRFFLLGYLLPSNLRNVLYRWVSRNRYRWFGRRDRC